MEASAEAVTVTLASPARGQGPGTYVRAGLATGTPAAPAPACSGLESTGSSTQNLTLNLTLSRISGWMPFLKLGPGKLGRSPQRSWQFLGLRVSESASCQAPLLAATGWRG